MQAYRDNTAETVNRFANSELTFQQCIRSLDTELARFILRMQPEQLNELRTAMLENDVRVIEELGRRGILRLGPV